MYAMLAMLNRSHTAYKKTAHVVDREIAQELRKAMEIAEIVRKQWKLEWVDIEKYVTQLPSDWSDLGAVLDLNFLSEHKYIS